MCAALSNQDLVDALLAPFTSSVHAAPQLSVALTNIGAVVDAFVITVTTV